MRKFLITLWLTLFLFSLNYSQNLKLEREIDLSFFLKPHQPHLVFAAIDSSGNIFITQRGKGTFLKLDPAGEVILTAPQTIEGEITKFDIDNLGNPVCVFAGRYTENRASLPLVWFDGITGKKIREINLGEKFNLVAHLKILRPKDIILVNGIAKDEGLPRHSLHLVDFNGNRLKSFSPLKEQAAFPEIVNRNPDYFAVDPKIDSNSLIIFQAFPSKGLIDYFDYAGNRLGDTEWAGSDLFLAYSGNLWIRDKDGFKVLEKKGDRFVPIKAKIKDDQGAPIKWYPLALDSSGKIYFLGDKTLQTLKIYRLQD
ncbi:MAG: hypothetical protein PHQ25_07535 [Acidobacteriota bacterium]|nr:hypothetical protein [Acidobacteriota bacterium]MDW3228299.1 hypothetical protein [Acidobacteriota bacterium]MDY0232195.1 hypothetical protein [Candidatus Saccharicenans sp.]